ncbi:MAG: toll/interleukin-1 receptor domain-containing protein [Leptolyngbya sp. SIO1D8]|nr:toll/interleukin-1 receptor domain-containing protein [Leptolyngbya sp. SIO1D8]
MGIEVFFSYSHRDEDLRDELAKHLSILQRRGQIDTWYDRAIEAGTEPQSEIDQHLNRADIILLLVSADFLASDYCYDVEVKRAMERHAAEDARVIPVILRPVDWQDAPFGQLQALPQDGQPITKWGDLDDALLNVEQGIRRSIQALTVSQEQKRINLYRVLLKLGYRQQAHLFLQAIQSESVAAFLIHGLPEYGQRWLLNSLVVQYLPEHLNSKVVKVYLSRLSRQSNVAALWRELGGQVRLKGYRLQPSDIADGVYRWWLTQDVILVFHDVHVLPESAVQEMVENFWIPLTQRVQEASDQESACKLLMFLVDYGGKAEQWNLPFVEKLDAGWKPQRPIKTPKLQEFTKEDLRNWLETQYVDLPSDLTQGINNKVEEILDRTEGGIPVLVLREICEQCGLNWYEELEKWLRL